MTGRLATCVAAAAFAAGAATCGCGPATVASVRNAQGPVTPLRAAPSLGHDLDAIFDAPVLARAMLAARVDSLRDGRTLYRRNADKLVIPASNLKLITMAVAADRLGWDYRFETTLETTGTVDHGVLRGDLVVVGGGDPSIVATDQQEAALFDEWADALRAAGIDTIDGRLIGDDDAFDDETLGAGWAWDYLSAGYAAPSSALSYNENVAVVRVAPAATAGAAARVDVGPIGQPFDVRASVTTTAAATPAAVVVSQSADRRRLDITGRVPLGGGAVIRTAAVVNPTRYFTEALRLTLAMRGIDVRGGAWDIDDLAQPISPGPRTVVARHRSQPLSALIGYAMKVSRNFYGEMILKAIGRSAAGTGSAETGRDVARTVLDRWALQATDGLVMYDGSGLSRYDYATADLLTGVLTHVYEDEGLRGPFLAALPVGGRDGTLQGRMHAPALEGRVQAKTGTIANVRALSGYLDTDSGDRLAFSMVANHFTAAAAEIDAIMDAALVRLASDRP